MLFGYVFITMNNYSLWIVITYSLKWGITIPYQKYWISIPSPSVTL